MRLHFRQLVLASAALIVIVCLVALYSFGNTNHQRQKIRQIEGPFPIDKKDTIIPTWEPGAIFWDGNSGVRTLSERVNQSSVLRFGIIKSWTKNKAAEVKVFEQADDGDLLIGESIEYNLNIYQSDMIPLNRDVPDSRPQGCAALSYPDKLPTTSVVIPFHNEWPSVIIRTIYSLINRTPKHLLKEIILVDDASTVNILKIGLRNFIDQNFPKDKVKLIRLEHREGLIRARLEGFRHITGEAVSFFDSHMEVNTGWLEPLLAEIVKNNRTLAMGQLDYIHRDTLYYNFYPGYRSRYGFRWDMQFFETFFRPDQLKGKKNTDPLPGVLMVGPGFVVDVNYFKQIGAYDNEMLIWGGENIELAWRVWMCGGQLLHVPCSHIGHIERSQPYVFPSGRRMTEMYNYKRAVDVWLGDYKKYVYNLFPGMKHMDVGNLSQRLAIKDKLGCQDFSWFIANVWPELLPYEENSLEWGQIRQLDGDLCLDNTDYVFQDPKPLELKTCTRNLLTQGFALTPDGRLRTTIHCVVAKEEVDILPFIENCLLSQRQPQVWIHNEHQQLLHVKTGLCLQFMRVLILQPCDVKLSSQKWVFYSEGLLEQNNQ